MNDGLVDLFRHNAWATRTLLGLSSNLTAEQLDTTVIGVYGSIIETFRHYTRSESAYFRRLTGFEAEWLRAENDRPDIAELARRNDEMEQRWLTYLETPFDAEAPHVTAWEGGGTRSVPAGVILAQAIHHGSDHRSQICTMLTVAGVDLPDMGLWDWADASGRVTTLPD